MRQGTDAGLRSGANRSSFLVELEQAHSDLLAAMGELAALTDGPVPAKSLLIDTRWNVSRTSLSRRLLWGRILMSLSARANADEEQKLRRLQDIDIELLRTSTKHVCAWTSDAVLQDWAGYREASRIVLSMMKSAITSEREMLYPMLAKPDPAPD